MITTDHVLRYLRDMYEKGILFSCGIKHTNLLWVWVDTDWTGDTDTHRSHTGFVLMFNDGPISWKSLRQDSVDLSTSEPEYMTDSVSTNPVRHKYSRHIDVHRLYVRELALTGLIKFIPLGTHDMVTDDLTKSLPAPALIRHREVMMGRQRFQSFFFTEFVHVLDLY